MARTTIVISCQSERARVTITTYSRVGGKTTIRQSEWRVKRTINAGLPLMDSAVRNELGDRASEELALSAP